MNLKNKTKFTSFPKPVPSDQIHCEFWAADNPIQAVSELVTYLIRIEIFNWNEAIQVKFLNIPRLSMNVWLLADLTKANKPPSLEHTVFAWAYVTPSKLTKDR